MGSESVALLCSVKIHKSIDFRDDQARRQIMVKTPYQDLGDEWVRLCKDRMG